MWRKCDLHNHTTPNEQIGDAFDADAFVAACAAEALDMVAVTDHDSIERVEPVMAAAQGTTLTVVPGVEISTDHGHVIAIAPGPNGLPALKELMARLGVGAAPQQKSFNTVVDAVREGIRQNNERFSQSILLVGSHVDRDGSLLGARQALAVQEQVGRASQLDALEVVNDSIIQQWMAAGIKDTSTMLPLLKGSDSHSVGGRISRSTWLYLPEVSLEAVSHAFATWESSLRLDAPPSPPHMVIESISFVGSRLHDELTFQFSERTNAIIGPPSSGKSLIIDALRFAFGQVCPVDEIAKVCGNRLERGLGPGSRVIVKGRGPDGQFVIDRVWGGAQEIAAPFSPIIFSQTELVRRAIEERPSMALLDVHAPITSDLKLKLQEITEDVATKLQLLTELGQQAHDLAVRVENPQDGLAAIRSRIAELAGTEAVAQEANELSRIRGWRERTKERVQEWLAAFEVPAPPFVADPPELSSTVENVERYLPVPAIETLIAKYQKSSEKAARELGGGVEKAIDDQEAALSELEKRNAEELQKRGFQLGEAVLKELQTLRGSLGELEEANAKLNQVRTEIDRDVEVIKKRIEEAGRLRANLREERKNACAAVNASMLDFFARLEEDFYTDRLDRLLEDAKVGTGRWKTSLEEVRDSLSRTRLVEVAIRSLEGRVDVVPEETELETQDQIATEAMSRHKTRQLAEIATLWPGDGLILTETATEKTFEFLTEGMRALAIKEISFAANQLPVVSDQPEDAVPPEAVYKRLVPTIRSQRSDRQFIFASHDANLVVAGDVERISVLRNPGQLPEEGTLVSESIREAAMQLLEGGKEAFEVRGKRYGSR